MSEFSDITLDSQQSAIIQEMKLNLWKNDRTIPIWGEITEDTEFLVNHMFEKIEQDDLLTGEKKPIKLSISTLGGDLFATFSIISKIEEMRSNGYQIIATAYGKCMSGGLFIFMAATIRICQRHSRLCFHQIQTFEHGNSSVESVHRAAEDLRELWGRLRDITKRYTKFDDNTLDKILFGNVDYSFFPEKGFNELGIVDVIL
jgi:ATP-dependent protease ClpP protease subunit